MATAWQHGAKEGAMPEKQAKVDEKNPPRVTVRLSSEMSRALKEIAYTSGRSDNAVYLEAFSEYLERHGKGAGVRVALERAQEGE